MLKQVNIRTVKENAVELIADRWLLVSAGDRQGYNMMTASWGMLGELWNKDVATVFIRPQRYTFQFMEQNDTFAVSVLPESLKKQVHGVCGSQSGRDVDKTAATGLIPVFDGSVYFEQAELVLVCRKIYVSDLDPAKFLDPSIENHYHGDYHRVYVGEIEKTLIKA